MPSSEGTSIGYQRGADVIDKSVELKQLLNDKRWLDNIANVSNYASFSVNQIDAWTADWPLTEDVTFVREPTTMKYTVLIRWDDNPAFEVPIDVSATSRSNAAQVRINLLSDPSRYDDVLVLEESSGMNHMAAEIFAISEFIKPFKDHDEPRSGADKPQPKFGWYGDAS